MKTIGLCMIVKNEAHIIGRCLDSVLPLIDYAVVVDTGSTDGTQRIVADWLRANDKPGAVVDESWRDFAHGRTFALTQLRAIENADYALMIDADEVLELEPGFDPLTFKSTLTADLYDIKTVLGGVAYYRPQLTRNAKPFYYKGVVHEYLECDGPFTRATAKGFHNRPIQDSARNRNPQKYRDDAATLERVLAGETDPFLISRYTFYLAQSWRDGGEPEKAIGAYLQRANMGYWDQERYCSLLYAGRLLRQQKIGGALEAFLRADTICPDRPEARREAAAMAAEMDMPELAAWLRARSFKCAADSWLFAEAV